MAKKPTPLYLARASYRQRRLVDAQRLLPVALLALFLLPLLWGGGQTGAPVGEGVSAMIYVFVVWGLGVGATFAFSIAMRHRSDVMGPDVDVHDAPTPQNMPAQNKPTQKTPVQNTSAASQTPPAASRDDTGQAS